MFLDIETIPPDEAVKDELAGNDYFLRLVDELREKHLRQLANGNNNLENRPINAEQLTEVELFEEAFRRLALRAEYGRLLAIGTIVEKDGEGKNREGVFGYDKQKQIFRMDEKKMLGGFWQFVEKEFRADRDLIIGHNVMDFDLPFIYKRSHINNVNPTIKLSFARYRNQPIYDTMREWAMWNLRETPVSLVHLAKLLELNLDKTEGLDGSRVYDEYLAGNHARIAEYCLQDVRIVQAIYHRLTNRSTSRR